MGGCRTARTPAQSFTFGGSCFKACVEFTGDVSFVLT